MAILGVGISDNATTSAYASLRRIVENNYPSSQYVVFSTELGSQFQQNIDISCSFRYVKRPGDAGSDNGWSQWSQWYWSRIPSTECRPHQVYYDSRWHWAIELSQIGEYLDGGTTPNPSGSIKNMLFPNGYALEQRKYDGIELQIHIKTQYYEQYWESQGGEFSDVAQNNSIVYSYVPNYYLKTATILPEGVIQIKYDAPAWQRNDDRFGVEEVYSNDTGENLLKTGKWWGSIMGYNGGFGYVRIGTSWLRRVPQQGEDIHVKIRMNAGFNAIDQWFGYLEGDTETEDHTRCSTPILDVKYVGTDSVQIRLEDAKDYDISYDQAYCSLSTEMADSDFEMVDNGGLYIIKYPPLEQSFEVFAIGQKTYAGSDEYLLSDMVSVTIPAIPAENRMFIGPLNWNRYKEVEIRYNVSENWSFEPESETVKFATRDYDSVAFGNGGSATGTLEFDIVTEHMYGEQIFQELEDFERLMFAGICVLRGPDGERRRIAVEDVDVSWDRYRRFRTVKISMRQVQ